MTMQKASGAEPLYMYRSVLNAEQILDWAREQGFTSALAPDDMHVTVVFSRTPFSTYLTDMARWEGEVAMNNVVVRGGRRSVEPLGDKGAVVLRFASDFLQAEHAEFRSEGASWDFPRYTPHITITYNGAPAGDPEPFEGDIVLGPLRAKLLNPDWDSEVVETDLTKVCHALSESPDVVSTQKGLMKSPGAGILTPVMDHEMNKCAAILKTDDEQRIVWGWAYVSTENGELLTDRQGDSIEPDEMVKMANDFMLSARTAKAMHQGEGIGEMIHSLPLTADLAKALGIETEREGWIVGMKVHDDAVWKRVKAGKFSGFSVSGFARERG